MKDIVCVVVEPLSEALLKIAADMARRDNARLTLVIEKQLGHVSPIALHVGGASLEADIASQSKVAVQVLRERTELALHGVVANVRWVEAEGGDDMLARLGRVSDLILLGRRDPDVGGCDQRVIAESLLSTGRPVMMVPSQYSRSLAATRILVGWNGSPQAARAVHDSMPLLIAAEEVEILMVVSGERGDTNIQPGALIRDHLQQHGVRVNVKIAPSDFGRGVDGILLDRSEEIDADLIVMGAFGRSKLHDPVFGRGVTSSVIQRSGIPLLLTH